MIFFGIAQPDSNLNGHPANVFNSVDYEYQNVGDMQQAFWLDGLKALGITVVVGVAAFLWFHFTGY